MILTAEKFKGDRFLVKFLYYIFLSKLAGDECTVPEYHWNDAFMKVCCPSVYRMIQWKHQPKTNLDILYLFKKSWFPSPPPKGSSQNRFRICMKYVEELCLYLSALPLPVIMKYFNCSMQPFPVWKPLKLLCSF